MVSFLDEYRAVIRAPVPWLSWGVLTAALALSGPFGTYMRFNLGQRLGFWGVVVGGCLIWGLTLNTALTTRFSKIHLATATVIVSVASAPLLALPIRALMRFMARSPEDPVPNFLDLTLTIFVIGLGMGVLRQAVSYPAGVSRRSIMRPAPAAGQASSEAPEPRLMARIEPQLRGDVIRLSARDHYLDVFTEKGKAELLMRFSDALAELDGVDGLQVHRSHWVAVPSVEGAAKEGDRLLLLLRDGSKVPVSRKYRPEVAARGLA